MFALVSNSLFLYRFIETKMWLEKSCSVARLLFVIMIVMIMIFWFKYHHCNVSQMTEHLLYSCKNVYFCGFKQLKAIQKEINNTKCVLYIDVWCVNVCVN